MLQGYPPRRAFAATRRRELALPHEVDAVLPRSRGTETIVVNSAGAREQLTTSSASLDREIAGALVSGIGKSLAGSAASNSKPPMIQLRLTLS